MQRDSLDLTIPAIIIIAYSIGGGVGGKNPARAIIDNTVRTYCIILSMARYKLYARVYT